MKLNWYRSWPAPEELAELKNRGKTLPAHVIDHLPQILMSKQNYATVSTWPDDEPGFCMLEWDVALDPVERQAFAAEALIQPTEILVAGYRIWNHYSIFNLNENEEWVPNTRGCEICGVDRIDAFGLGCIYIPQVILRTFLTQMDHYGFSDHTFSLWYHRTIGPARLTWKIRPQHLHAYETS